MSPVLKKLATALAVKEVIDRVQAARQPKRTFFQRIRKPIAFLGLAGAGAWAFKSGKLQGLIGGKASQGSSGTYGNGQSAWSPSPPTFETTPAGGGTSSPASAPAATTGTTAEGVASTSGTEGTTEEAIPSGGGTR